jgi:hypothetical protein
VIWDAWVFLLLFTFEQATQFVYLLYLFIITRHGRGGDSSFTFLFYFRNEVVAVVVVKKRQRIYHRWRRASVEYSFCLFFCKCLSIYCFFFLSFFFFFYIPRQPLYHPIFFSALLYSTLIKAVFLFYLLYM